MARRSSQNAPPPSSDLTRDFSNANLTLSYTGGVAAQSAADLTAEVDELFTPSLDMRPGNTPRSVPPAHRSPSRIQFNLATPFPGRPSAPSTRNYVLAGNSQIGLQNTPTDIGQSIDLSGESSRPSLRTGSDLPWTHLEATVTPPKATSNRNRRTSSTVTFRTPSRNIGAFPELSISGSFHDSALGTLTGSSQHETQSLLSSSHTEMENNFDFGMTLPEPQEVLPVDHEDDVEPQGEPDDDEPQPSKKNPRQPRSKAGLTCPICQQVIKTRSDFKKHQARHENPFKCKFQDCQRSGKGFATVNDLIRHEKCVHLQNTRGSKYYKCFASDCPKADKKWPRLDNFKQHLIRMHSNQSVQKLVDRSNEWYESQFGAGAPAQPLAVTAALHQQEAAVRSQSQQKRRLSAASSEHEPPRKRTAGPPVRTQDLQHPRQDPTRLLPLSAHPVNRSSQPTGHRINQPDARILQSDVRLAANQTQRSAPQSQPQGSNRAQQHPLMQVPRRRNISPTQAQGIVQTQSQQDFSFQWNGSDQFGFIPNVNTTQSAHDQQCQLQQSPFQNFHHRPHTAPDINPDYDHIRYAFLEETRPTPSNDQDPSVMDVEQYLVCWGENLPPGRSPDTSNEPQTPDQPLSRLPSIAVEAADAESEDENSNVQALSEVFADRIRSFLQQHGSKSDEARRLLKAQDFDQILGSLASQSSLASPSDAGVHQKSTGSTSSRTGKTNHICPDCAKMYPRHSDLTKHLKRHSRPYGCVVDNCYKRFGSKNDWKRHEGKTHPEQMECYRCDGSHCEADGKKCFKVFYKGRESYKMHLMQLVTTDPHQLEVTATERRIPANNQGRFWCGFCEAIIVHECHGPEAQAKRLSHIDNHFSKGKSAAEWVELAGNGLKKEEIERNHDIEKHHRGDAGTGESGHQNSEDNSQRSSSSPSSFHHQDDTSGNQVPASPVSPVFLQQRQQQQQQIQEAQRLQGTLSNAPQYQQLTMQQEQQMAQQMQRARSQSQGRRLAQDMRDPPQIRSYNQHGQRLATRAQCCECNLEWPLDFGRKCTACNHHLCPTCRCRE